jgi:ethanolamine ammonia-lyase large subunit
MGVPGSDDIMLNYQSTSFHDALYLRNVLGLKPAPEFEQWLIKQGIVDKRGMLTAQTDTRFLNEMKSLWIK